MSAYTEISMTYGETRLSAAGQQALDETAGARFALAIGDAVGTYPVRESYRLAVWEAVDLARSGQTVTVLRVTGIDNDVVLEALFTASPPITPPATSPSVPTGPPVEPTGDPA